MSRSRIYLAGPEVFLPDARRVGAEKAALCARYGFDGVFPLDAALDLDGLSPRQQGRAIYRADVAMMRSCQMAIVNLTPFRGPSADVGTAFEMGFMTALGRPVLAYSNSPKSFRARLEEQYRGRLRRRPDGQWADPDGLAVEDFDMLDNLMLHGALNEGDVFLHQAPPGQDYRDLTAFEDCLKAATALFP